MNSFRQILRYLLIAIGWAFLAFAHGIGTALPAQKGAELNAFLAWRGNLETPLLLKFFFNAPQQIIRDFQAGVDVPLLHLFYATTFLFALMLAFFAPLVVARVRSNRGLLIFRALAVLMFLPIGFAFAPASQKLPLPEIGLWCIFIMFVCCAAAIFIPPPTISRERKPS